MTFLNSKSRHLGPSLLAMMLTLSTGGLAQTAPPDAGEMLRETRRPPAPLPTPRPTLSVPGEKDGGADSGEQLTVSAIKIEGAVHIDVAELQPLVADLVGKPVTLGQLRAGSRQITAYYRAAGYVVARAYIPAQDLVDGVLRMTVLEGTLNSSAVANKSAVDKEYLASVIEAQELNGKVIASSTTDRALLLIADLPSVGAISGKLHPGQQVGTSDLVVSVDPGKRVEGEVSADTYGNRYTGRNRVNGNLSYNSPTGIGDRLGLQATVTGEDLMFGRASYDLPLNSNGLRGGVALSLSRYELGQEFASLDAKGTARSATLYGSFPALRGLNQNVWLSANIEYRALQDEIASVHSKTDKNAVVATFEAYGDLLDSVLGGGYSTWRISGMAGRLSIETDAALASDRAGPKTDGDYGKLVASLGRIQAIVPTVSAAVNLSGQIASKNLDSSEKFVIGGIYGVRAYPQGEGAGDQGWLGNLELRWQMIPALQAAVFLETGYVEFNANKYASGKNTENLQGFGTSLTGTMEGITGKVTLAWRGNSDRPATAPDRFPRIWASLGWRF